MFNKSDLVTLQKGDIINHYLLLRKSEIKLTKSNKQYLYLELADKTLALSANVWENFSNYLQLKPGDVVKVSGSMDDFNGAPQIKIISIQLAEPGDNITAIDFLAKSKRDFN